VDHNNFDAVWYVLEYIFDDDDGDDDQHIGIIARPIYSKWWRCGSKLVKL